MSFNSLNDLSAKIEYQTESSSQNDGSKQSNGNSNSRQSTEEESSTGSIEQSLYESNLSTRSVRMKISPVSTALNSINEKIQPSAEQEDIETAIKCLQTGSNFFDSHTYSNYDQKIDVNSRKISMEQLDGDLQLPLAEEQDIDVISACRTKNLCSRKGLTNNGDPVENLISATLAFKEASHNQCDLLRAQTSAINRLATAIEDQTAMMSRFHSVIPKPKTKKYPDDDSQSSDYKLYAI